MKIERTFHVMSAMAWSILIASGMPGMVIAQPTASYNQTLSDISLFESQRTYTAADTGPLLDSIFQGMIQSSGVPSGFNSISGPVDSEGLKKRLVGSVSTKKLKLQAAAAINPDEGKLLELLYYTRQSPVPVFITDVQLLNRVNQSGGNGNAIRIAVIQFWKNKSITTNLIDCLAGFPPEQAAALVDVISAPFYSGASKIYEASDTSWASQSLWRIYRDLSSLELARRSAVIKLLVKQGYVSIPSYTVAQFTTGHDDIYITGLYGAVFEESDVPELQSLLNNPYYAAAARAQLTLMGH